MPFAVACSGQVDTVETPKLFTKWSLVHITTGTILYSNLLYFHNISFSQRFIIMQLLHLAYECHSIYISYFKNGVGYWDKRHGDSVWNSIGDQLSCTIGYMVMFFVIPHRTFSIRYAILTYVLLGIAYLFAYGGD